jgi:hypothetical protein
MFAFEFNLFENWSLYLYVDPCLPLFLVVKLMYK